MAPARRQIPRPNLFYSTAIDGDIAALLGAPHYSYHFAASRFVGLLARMGHAPRHLPMPEYYATGAALPERKAGPDVHLIFRSSEQIRLLKPAVNVACFAWEFPVLKADLLPGEHPFADQRFMLSLCDEVWTPSRFALGVLQAHGVTARHIPAPVSKPQGGRMDRAAALDLLAGIEAMTLDVNFAWPAAHQQARTSARATTIGAWHALHCGGGTRPKVFLAVLNPEDFRKNLDAMLRGFASFRATCPAAILLVKALTSAARFTLAQVAGGVIANKLAPGTVLRDDGIAVINAYLDDDAMTALYSLADFYLCTSLAEGQNLPLLEAMAHGTVAVTTANTAMAEYVTPERAFVIATRPVANDTPHLAGTVARRPFEVALCSARAVHEALSRAEAAGRTALARRRAAAAAAVEAQFGEAAVGAMLTARLAALAGPGA